MLLTACQSLCDSAESLFGEDVVRTVCTIAGLVLVWYRGRANVAKVETRAVNAEQQATAAKVEVRALRLSLPAAVQSSLPPPADPGLVVTPEIVPLPDAGLLRGEGALPKPSITPRVDK